ncbi:MAG: peptidoglycan-binding domain-containing protein [Rhodomicrobium sp.]
MRTIFLSLLSLAALFGIPRLVNEYRAPQLEAKEAQAIAASPGTVSHKLETQSAAAAAPIPARPGAMPVERPVAVQLVPVSLRPAEFSAVPASEAPALPGDGRELISAIQKELSRLGYYDGPNSGRWSKAVRHGVREFIRRTGGRHVHHPQPSLELLASLQAANLVELEAKPENSSDRHPIRQAELRPARSPVEAIAATPQPAQSDDYLPPWMTRHASAAKSEANSAADVTPPAGARDITRQVHRKRHRRERGWNAYAYRGWGGGDWGF